MDTTDTKSKSLVAADNVAALLRARTGCIWIVTKEEKRVEGYLAQACIAAKYVPRFWDCAQGTTNLAGQKESSVGSPAPDAMLETIADRTSFAERGAWIMRDLPSWLRDPVVLRRLVNIARERRFQSVNTAQAVIVISSSGEVAPELQGLATVVDWPLPDRSEINLELDSAIGSVAPDKRETAAASLLNGARRSVVDAAIGLSAEEAHACFAKSLVQTNTINPESVVTEKKQIISASRVLECMDSLTGGFAAIGGLDGIKNWMLSRSAAYSPAARAYGLPTPKGILLIGVPGCGKTMIAKAIATILQGLLIKFDFGALRGKYVGQSEGNLRAAIKTTNAIGRSVVLVDEIEKALAGATQGAADGGVSADALGAFLSWMQDRTSEAFVVATANNVETLPPELLRKGRFDEVFFVDLPSAGERESIVRATLRTHKRNPEGVDVPIIARITDGFTGSEIAELVPTAMYSAFADNARPITTGDLVVAANATVPLSRTAAEKITKLRDWAKGRARNASAAPVASTATPQATLDL